MPVSPQLALENQLLAAMAPADIEALALSFELVDIHQHDVLSRPGIPDDFAYFPLSGICSLIAASKDGVRVEVGMVGHDGFTGAAIVLHAEHDPNEVIVQVEGRALKLPRLSLLKNFEARPFVRMVLLRYVYIMTIQTSQTALANGSQTIETRLARWLLMSQDRVGAAFPVTHEFLAVLLSVRRAGITEALHGLEGKRLIRSSRGTVVVVDRPGLEELAGTAYGLPEQEHDRLIKSILPGVSA